jgi:polyhydroxyalkanoic acid synthase PhaR subunit
MSDRESKSRPDPKAAADPFQAWRDWIDQAERQWNGVFSQLMQSERFSATNGKLLEALMALQASMNAATERYFHTLNLPTRSDLMTVSEGLARIEQRLDSLERALRERSSQAVEAPPARPKPPRTRKPPETHKPPRTRKPQPRGKGA